MYVRDLFSFIVTEGCSAKCSVLVLSKRGGRNTLGTYPYPERKEINRSRRFLVFECHVVRSTFLLFANIAYLTLRRLMSYIYGAPILDVSRSHTTTQHSR